MPRKPRIKQTYREFVSVYSAEDAIALLYARIHACRNKLFEDLTDLPMPKPRVARGEIRRAINALDCVLDIIEGKAERI